MNRTTYSKFKHLLVDPYTKESLLYHDDTSTFSSETNRYFTTQNVCVFMSSKNKNQQEFNYIEHYQNDGKEFDYNKEYSSKATRYEVIKLQQTITSLIKSKPTITILDIGCGNGWVAKEFIKKGCNVISVDISLENTSRIKKEIPSDNHLAIIADAYNLPIKNGSIDYIIAAEIMEHVIDPSLFIASLYKVLKTDGELIITTPYNEVIEHSLCIHCNKKTPKNAHLHSFNEKNIAEYIPNDITLFNSFGIHNFILIKLRIHQFLHFLPLKIWFFIDKTANLIYKKPYRLVLLFKKKNTAD